MKLFVADYIVDTADLSLEEHGAYLLLLAQMWRAGGRLRYDPPRLARTLRCDAEQFDRVWGAVGNYFDELDGHIYNARLTEELADARRLYAVRSKAGAKGGRISSKIKAKRQQNPKLVSTTYNDNDTRSLTTTNAGARVLDYLATFTGVRYGLEPAGVYLLERLDGEATDLDARETACMRAVEAAVAWPPGGTVPAIDPLVIFSRRWFGELVGSRNDSVWWAEHGHRLDAALGS